MIVFECVCVCECVTCGSGQCKVRSTYIGLWNITHSIPGPREKRAVMPRLLTTKRTPGAVTWMWEYRAIIP